MKNYKEDFPILQRSVHGKPLIYLDSSASSQKPKCVINAISQYYENDHANVHRGIYHLSELATRAYEKTRVHCMQFINAKHAHEIIFVRGATEAINLVAQCHRFSPGDEVIVSTMEHHSNIVPWQLAGATLRAIPLNTAGELDLHGYQELFSARTKMVAIIQASNVLGTINPIQQMAKIAHAHDVPILVDGAQAFPHMSVDVQQLDCDFYVFSAHKAYGPTGVGVLYGKTQILDKMPPYHGGGSMIETVTFEKSTYSQLPYKFEAGTPNIADVVGFNAALSYLSESGMDLIWRHEQELLDYATQRLSQIPGLQILGCPENKVGVISFVIKGIHPHDIATILDTEGIAVRAGHHCAMPLMHYLNVSATTRVSFGIYNTKADVDALIAGLHKVIGMFS